MEELTPKELVGTLDRWLHGCYGRTDYEEIKKSVSLGAMTDIIKAREADLAVFILGACFIDAMASFYFGVTKELLKDENNLKNKNKKAFLEKYPNYVSPSKRFTEFVKIYLPPIYNKDEFYKSFRSGLIHSYAEPFGKYAFSANNFTHHQIIDGKRIIKRQNFIDELNSAYTNFRGDILKDDQIFKNARERYKTLGLMVVSTPNNF